MELIRNLLPYIDPKIFVSDLRGARLLEKLFALVSNNTAITNDEASLGLFGKESNRDAFKQVKLRLRKKLLSHISQHGVVSRNIDSYSSNYRKCMTQFNAVRTLMMNNAREAAAELGEILIKTTFKYEYTDLTLSLSRDLFIYYSSINYDYQKLHRYQKLMHDMQRLYNAEIETYEYYGLLRAAILLSRGGLKREYLQKSKEYAERANELLEQPIQSYQLLVSSYLILAIHYEANRDYRGLIQVCESAINKFQNRTINRRAIFYHLDIYKITCLIQLAEYQEVERIAQKYFDGMTPGTLNWFVLKLYLIISKLHSQNYKQAYIIHREIKSIDAYRKQAATMLQTWVVYEAHIEFLIAIGKIPTSQPSTFRLNKFLNEIPIYTKDKRGLNIAILIIQVLFLLQQRKYSQIIDRADALNQYCYRYLRKDDTFRSHCFIRMLLQMPRADFNRKRTERYAEPYVTKLRSVPLTISEQSIEVEVIPYEDLWEMTLELLD